MRPALSLEIERGARLFFPEAIRLPLSWSEGPRLPANRAYSFARQAPLLRAQKDPSTEPAFPAGLEGVKFPYIRKFISVYRKNIFAYAEIYFLAKENFSPCGRRKIFVPTQGNFYAHENKFSCARKFCALPTEENFHSEGREFPWARKDAARGRGWQREAKGLHLGGTPRGASSPL